MLVDLLGLIPDHGIEHIGGIAGLAYALAREGDQNLLNALNDVNWFGDDTPNDWIGYDQFGRPIYGLSGAGGYGTIGSFWEFTLPGTVNSKMKVKEDGTLEIWHQEEYYGQRKGRFHKKGDKLIRETGVKLSIYKISLSDIANGLVAIGGGLDVDVFGFSGGAFEEGAVIMLAGKDFGKVKNMSDYGAGAGQLNISLAVEPTFFFYFGDDLDKLKISDLGGNRWDFGVDIGAPIPEIPIFGITVGGDISISFPDNINGVIIGLSPTAGIELRTGDGFFSSNFNFGRTIIGY